MFNSDTFQLLILTTAAGYATYTLTNRPRTHIIEGNTGIDETSNETSNITSKISTIEDEINDIIEIVGAFLKTEFEGGRHQNRIDKF